MHIIQEIRRHPIRGWKTLAQLCCYLMIGMSVGVMGPSLLDLRQQVQVSLTRIALIMTARAGGHVLGSLLMGIIYSRINYQVATSVMMTISAAMTLTVPFMTQIWPLLAVFAINGVVTGFCEAGSNVFLLTLWGKETSPFMQVMHSLYGIGALIGPLLCSPYLLVREEVEEIIINDNETFHPELINLHVPYSVVAAVLFFTAVFSIILYKLYPETTPHPSRQPRPVNTNTGGGINTVSNLQEEDRRIRSASGHGSFIETRELASHEAAILRSKDWWFTFWKVAVVICAMLFMHAFYGIEQALGSFLLTFAVNSQLHLTKHRGAQLTTLFWTSFSISRFPKILMINCLGNAPNIFLGLAIMMLGNVILLPFGDTKEIALWVGVALIGIGGSSIWACVYGYLDQYFPVTSFIGSLIFVSAVVGEFVFPVIISSFIEWYPLILLWVVMGCTVAMIFFFLLITIICRSRMTMIE